MKKIMIMFTVFLSVSTFADPGLPKPAGKIEDAKIELCDGKDLNETMAKYSDAIMGIKGVKGFGRSVFHPEENPFHVICPYISVYADLRYQKEIKQVLGETLDGYFVEIYDYGGDAEIQ